MIIQLSCNLQILYVLPSLRCMARSLTQRTKCQLLPTKSLHLDKLHHYQLFVNLHQFLKVELSRHGPILALKWFVLIITIHIYPSYALFSQFWNSLVRKNKTEGVSEDDMESVVRIHNNMNESTWTQILEWEKLHPQPKDEGKEPTLLRFLGRPDQLSPKAQLKVILGHQPPFDRHDWVVDRGGKEVRYVIDYYHDEAHAAADKTPTSMKDLHSIRSIKLDVRPALDSFEALLDRTIRMPISQYLHQTSFKSLPLLPPGDMKKAEQQHLIQLSKYMMQIQERCEPQRLRLIACKTEQECKQAAIAMQQCTACVVCPASAKELELALNAEPVNHDKLDKSYATMIKCLELFESDLKGAARK